MIFSVIVTAVILIVLAAACIRAVCISGGFGKGRRDVFDDEPGESDTPATTDDTLNTPAGGAR